MWCYNQCCGSASLWCEFRCGSVFIIWCGSGSISYLQTKAQTLEKVLNRLIFHTFWLDICKLMRIRIRFRNQLINFDADPAFYLMRMRIQVTKMMRIRIHNRFFTWILLVGDDEAGPHDEVDEDEGVVGEGQQVPGHRYALHTGMQQQWTNPSSSRLILWIWIDLLQIKTLKT